MMNGIEILTQTNIYKTEAYPWLIAICASIGLLIGLGAAIYNWTDYGFDTDDLGPIVGCVIIGAWVGFLGFIVSEHDTDTVDYIEYKVTVSEDVNFAEFMDKYEILDQDGKIYTVKERE